MSRLKQEPVPVWKLLDLYLTDLYCDHPCPPRSVPKPRKGLLWFLPTLAVSDMMQYCQRDSEISRGGGQGLQLRCLKSYSCRANIFTKEIIVFYYILRTKVLQEDIYTHIYTLIKSFLKLPLIPNFMCYFETENNRKIALSQ